jgi:isochorismate hydrolase
MSDQWVFQHFCRKANMMHESKVDDIRKLLEFFTYCKQQNTQFFYDFQLDGDRKILSLFWSHESQ